MGHDVFISYAADNKLVADAMLERLEDSDIKCWIAPRNIRPGDSWGGAIVRAIESSKILILVFSSKSNQSQQVLREVERAVQRDVVLLPFRIEEIVPSIDLEYFLSTTQWLDAFGTNLEEHLDSLVDTVNHIISQREADDPTSLPIQSVLSEDLQPELDEPLESASVSEFSDQEDSAAETSLDIRGQEPSTSELDVQQGFDIEATRANENPDIFEKLSALNLVSKETDELNSVVERIKRGFDEHSDSDQDSVNESLGELSSEHSSEHSDEPKSEPSDEPSGRASGEPAEIEQTSSATDAPIEPATEILISDLRHERSFSEIELDSHPEVTPPSPEPKDKARPLNPELIIERNNTRKVHSTNSPKINPKLAMLLTLGVILIAGGWYGFQNRDFFTGSVSSNGNNDSSNDVSRDAGSSRAEDDSDWISNDDSENSVGNSTAQPEVENVVEQAKPARIKNQPKAEVVAKRVERKSTPTPKPEPKNATPPPAQNIAKDEATPAKPEQAETANKAKVDNAAKTEPELETKVEPEVIPKGTEQQAIAEQQIAAQALRNAQLKEEQQRGNIPNLIIAAEQGELDAVLQLASAYEEGAGVDKDLTESAKWTRVAAEGGDADSQYKLSKLLSDSTSSDQDLQTAVFWAEQAANQNHAQAQNLLGLWFEKGTGVEKNYSTAYQWYNMAAQGGDMNGQKSLGIFNEFGLGRPQNHQEALRWYKLAADQGDARANF